MVLDILVVLAPLFTHMIYRFLNSGAGVLEKSSKLLGK
jgi:hypothetical protein